MTGQPMDESNFSLDNFVNSDWQVLGMLTISTRTESVGLIQAWLAETLQPLQLQGDFLDKITTSAQQAVEGASRGEKRAAFEHFHLFVFSQGHSLDHKSTWGFFRIEKIEQSHHPATHPDHAIEIYLYPEGHKRVTHPDQSG
jgi:hypothetical protein